VPIGSDEVVDALFLHTGVIRVDTLAQLFDVASVLAQQPLPAGRRVGIVANAGGSGVLVADACEDAGLVIPPLGEETVRELRSLLGDRAAVGNPVTVAGTASADAYERAVALVLGDEAVDAVIVSFLHPLATSPEQVAAAVQRASARSATVKPVVGNFMGGGEVAGMPVFAYPEAAAQALARVAGLVEWRARPSGSLPTFDDADHERARGIVDSVLVDHPAGATLEPAVGLDLLRSYRIPVARTAAVTSADEAMDAAATIGLPVTLRREGGETRTGLATPADVARAWDSLGATGAVATGAVATGAVVTGAVVQEAVEPGVETVVGVSTHPSFGPLLSFGTAGPAAEIYGDRALRVLPLTDAEADELVRSVKGAPLLLGYRGQQPTDIAALCDLLLRVSRLALDLPEVAHLTLEPVVVSANGVVAVDARVAVAPYRPLPELALRRLR
jgi:acetate---CoA ligase (ADP-forming)